MLRALRRPSEATGTDRQASRNTSRGIVLCRLVVLLALLGIDAVAGPPDRSLVEDLRKGGYVLFVRHFETNHDQKDTDPLHPDNVAAQRQLTDTGRAQAVAFGQALRALAVPIGSVICSQFQRAHESAQLIAVGEPAATPDVSAVESASSPEEKKGRTDALRRLLSTPPPPGKNTLIVSHNYNLRDAAGVELADVGEGEVVVFQPAADRTFRMVARIFPPSIWTEWSKQPR